MAKFDEGDRVRNTNIRHPDFDECGKVTGRFESAFGPGGVNVKKDHGGNAQWRDNEITGTV